MHGGALRIYSTNDVVGVEVGGAVKNVLAIATGICDALELGLNARADGDTIRLELTGDGKLEVLAPWLPPALVEASRTAPVDAHAQLGLSPGDRAAGRLSARGSTNFVHDRWASFDIRDALARKLNKPVTYLNDGNAGALWGHFAIFGSEPATSISAIVGTGLGGGVIVDGTVVKGRKGFGGELGHVLIPYQSITEIAGLRPDCNCGRIGDLESLCSLTAIRRTLLVALFHVRVTSAHRLR